VSQKKDRVKSFALEAETAISKLPVNEHDYLRFQVAHNIKQLYKQYNGNKDPNRKHAKNERKLLTKSEKNYGSIML
jgi:hypothetical protein